MLKFVFKANKFVFCVPGNLQFLIVAKLMNQFVCCEPKQSFNTFATFLSRKLSRFVIFIFQRQFKHIKKLLVRPADQSFRQFGQTAK